MPEPIKRNYHLQDEDLILEANIKRGLFEEDKADFINYDADFADPYSADFLLEINAANNTPDDETVVDQQQQLTNAVLAEMTKCRNKFQDSKFFIEKAFPTDAAVQNEFGFNDYSQAQKSQATFTKFMYKFHSIAVKYKVKLIAENYVQAKIDEIKTLADLLRDADLAQELFIKNRPVITQDRITKMNTVYGTMVIICKAGKRIYKDDYAKYQRYLLPPGEEEAEAFSVTGAVTNSATSAPEENVTVSIESLGISTATNGTGLYGFGALPAGTYSIKFTKAGLVEKIIDNVVITAGSVQTLNVVMDPV